MKSVSPHIIQIVNNSDKEIEYVDIGGSYASRMAKNFGQEEGITITSLVQGVSYGEFLAGTEKRPFTVEKTVVKASSADQLAQRICLIFPLKERRLALRQAGQTDQRIDNNPYLFDGSLLIRLDAVLPKSKVVIYLYTMKL